MSGEACGSWCGWCGGCTSGVPYNAICSQCRREFYKGRFDDGSLCDDCCRERDASADAAEATAAEQREYQKFNIRKPQTPAA